MEQGKDFAGYRIVRERFQRESRLLASIDHPNVITVFEAGEASGQLFISMRWVDGTDLRGLVSANGNLDPGRAAAIVTQVGAALDAAHGRGLVHRDVKPANVLIERRNGSDHAWLTDFGLSKQVDSNDSLTASGHWVGTLDYIAPEQIQGGRVDARADVYALGCVFFHALTGRVPYARDSEPAKLWAHMNEPPPSAREQRPELPEELDRVIARAMAKDPADRYPSAGDLSRAALAAARGAAPAEPERSVATGAAAPSDDETVQRAGGLAKSDTRSHAIRPTPGDGAEGTATAARPGGRKRSKLRVPLIAGAAALAVVGGVLALALGGGGAPAQPETGPLPAPRKAQVEHIDIGDRAAPSSVAAAVNTVYVLDPLQRELIAVDHGSGQVAGRVDVGRGASFVVLDEFGDDRAWVANQAESSITEIDLDSGDVVRTFHVDAEPRYVEVLPDELVILTSRDDGGGLLRVDKDTGRDAGRPREVGGAITDLVSHAGRLWVTTAFPPLAEPFLTNLEPIEGEEVKLPVDGIPADMVIDERGVAWVAGFETGKVFRVDLDSGRQTGPPLQAGPKVRELVIDDDGVLWVPSEQDSNLTRFDTRSGRRIGGPIDIGRNSAQLAASGGVVWVSGARDLIRVQP